MVDLLSLLGLGGDSQNAPSPPIANAPPSVSGVDVTATRPQVTTPGGSTAYNNIPEINAIQNVASQYPQGMNDHLGVTNMLNSKGQSGGGVTLRNLLGTLGDAFLIQAGKAPIHAEQNQRQQIADAAAGFQNNPGIAASRIAATAAPGSMQDAQTLYEADQQNKLRQQMQEQNNFYRQNVIQQRQAQQMDRIAPAIGAMLTSPNIKTADDYKAAHDRATSMLQRIDPDATPADVGAVDPADWKPGIMTNAGMTAGQVARNQTSQDSIAERANAAAANVSKPSNAAYIQNLASRVNNGETLGPGDQAIWNAQTQRSNKPKLNIPGLTPAPSAGSGGPTSSDIAYLRANPGKRALFEAHFGAGSASKVLGQ